MDEEAHELPLREIVANLKDGENTIVISRGEFPAKVLRHSIQSISHIRVAQIKDGSYSAVAIESLNGQTTILNIGVPVSPKP